jgi:hypothetical protein
MAVRNDFAPGEVLAAADLNDSLDAKLNLAGGKILQIVRATDATTRTTTSTTFVDVTGMAVTITPQKSTSAILVISSFYASATGTTFAYGNYRISDSSNNALNGAQNMRAGLVSTTQSESSVTIIGYSTPATTSAVTYKLRFCVDVGTGSSIDLENAVNTGQMYAIEVSA